MRARYLLGSFVLVLLGFAPSAAQGQSCIQQWSAPFPAGDLDGIVYAMTVYNDGTGPALYVGGTFENARGIPVNRIAKWNGTSWSALGPGVITGSGVYALAVYNDGTGPALYAGGSFVEVGYSVTANNIAKWNGSYWSRIGSGSIPAGTIGAVWALTTYADDPNDPNMVGLYVGGTFTQAGDVANANRIARWGKVGTSLAWSALGTAPYIGMDNGVYALAVFDDDGTGPNRAALYAGGGFLTAGSVGASRIAKWSKVGSAWTWSALPGTIADGVNSTVWSLAVYDDDGTGPHLPGLYVGGRFTTAGGSTAKKIARWSRSGSSMTWSAVGSGFDGGDVYALAIFDDDGSGADPTQLFAAGNFTQTGALTTAGVAAWNGTSWSALGTGVVGTARALGVFDEDGAGPNTAGLFVGGDLTEAGQWSVGGLARWGCAPPGPSAACCFGDGTCQMQTSTQCAVLGGTYKGDGTTCTPNLCPQPTGACCYANYTCAVTTEAACTGTWLGANALCSQCPQAPTGACCTNYVCTVATEAACTAGGGTWKGAGTTCTDGICVLRGDLNCDGIISFADINPFVLRLADANAYKAAYPNCPDENGDINADGVVSFADINPFVALLGG